MHVVTLFELFLIQHSYRLPLRLITALSPLSLKPAACLLVSFCRFSLGAWLLPFVGGIPMV